jgi:hypothetical protein
MSAVTYRTFDLLVERFGGGYRARVLDSPAGQAIAELPSPFDQLNLERFLARVGRPYRGLAPHVDRGAGSEPDVRHAVVTFGTRLFNFLFADEIRTSLRRSLDEAERQGAGLRIRLRLADVPELAELPWEFLYDPALGNFLALSAKTPLVRYLDLAARIQPVAVHPPLRILVVVASPTDAAPLDGDQEWRILQGSLAGLEQEGRISLERPESATIPALQEKLRRGEYHVFHFVGHGTFDEDQKQGVLLMEDQYGESMPLSAQALGTLLRDEADTLRLVVLNACHGARTSQDYPFAGLAQEVVRKGIPAVIAMQFAITDEAAVTFTRAYYRAIADAYPVDAAFGEARKAIYFDDNQLEWATPVLFMRAPDGVLWDVASAEEEQEPMGGKEEGAWWDSVSVQAGGDVIIGYVGAGASGVAIGKDITQNVYGVLGQPEPDDRQIIERKLTEIEDAMQHLDKPLDASTAAMAEFQLGLLRSELTKTEKGETPSASTITQVGGWLLDNVPSMVEILASLFATPAVGRVVGRAGETAVQWLKQRFGEG